MSSRIEILGKLIPETHFNDSNNDYILTSNQRDPGNNRELRSVKLSEIWDKIEGITTTFSFNGVPYASGQDITTVDLLKLELIDGSTYSHTYSIVSDKTTDSQILYNTYSYLLYNGTSYKYNTKCDGFRMKCTGDVSINDTSYTLGSYYIYLTNGTLEDSTYYNNGSYLHIKFYDNTGKYVGWLCGTNFTSSSSTNKTWDYGDKIAGTIVFYSNSNARILPSTSSLGLGSTSRKFSSVYTSYLGDSSSVMYRVTGGFFGGSTNKINITDSGIEII